MSTLQVPSQMPSTQMPMTTQITPSLVTPPTNIGMPLPNYTTSEYAETPAFNMKKWLIIGVLVVLCCASVGVGLWFAFFREYPKTKKECVPGDQSKSEYTRRVESGSDWVCPSGYIDTGCTWDDADKGELQCRRPRTTKCAPGDEKKSTYTRRVQSGSNWVCPSGFVDTGCGWSDTGKGELQCRKNK